jgi:hypothetical protein
MCMVIQDNMPAFNLLPLNSKILNRVAKKSHSHTRKNGIILSIVEYLCIELVTQFISPIDLRKKGRVVNHHMVDGLWVCIYVMVYCLR